MLHTIQVDDLFPILPPVVGWVAAATLVIMFPKGYCNIVCELRLTLSGTMSEMGFTA